MIKMNFGAFIKSTGLAILTVLVLSACGNRFEEQLRGTHQSVQSNLTYLKEQLDTKQLTNGLLIEMYANSLMKQKSDYQDIATLLKKEATSQGQAYTGLTKRLAAVNLSPTSTETASNGLRELQLITSAADVYEFNNSLADVVNTLASLSDGQLAVVNVPASQKPTAQQANALVGNPSYGSWQRGSDGRSFWAWYGMYSMFRNTFGYRPYYYSSWSSRPHYSYYGNYGRSRWGSDRDVSQNRNLRERNPSRYNKPSAAAKKRYATTSSRSSRYGGSASRSTSKSSSSRYSSYGSSSRSSSFTSSRGSRSGK